MALDECQSNVADRAVKVGIEVSFSNDYASLFNGCDGSFDLRTGIVDARRRYPFLSMVFLLRNRHRPLRR